MSDDAMIIGSGSGNGKPDKHVYVNLTLKDPSTASLAVESNAPNYDIMLNMLSQATRFVETKREEAVMVERMQQAQAAQLAASLTQRRQQ